MNLSYTLYLGSKSPRRQQLLAELGFPFEVKTKEVEEVYPADLPPKAVPAYLAQLKAAAFTELQPHEVVLTSDTIVLAEGKVLGKPKDEAEASQMLQTLGDASHEVITAFCLKSAQNELLITDSTRVQFRPLTAAEINHYIKQYQPYDKAGAYGIQEWIGMIGITKIEGSYFTVMGLPLHQVYKALTTFYP